MTEHEPSALWDHIQPDSARRLVAAAADAFADRGFHATTTRELAERAGLSAAAVYFHYRAKNELLFAISDAGHRDVLDHVQAALDAAQDPVQRVHDFVAAHTDWHARNQPVARVIEYELAALSAPQYARIRELRRRFAQLLGAELERGAASGVFAISNVEGTTTALLSLGIDVARWYSPARGGDPAQLGRFYGELALRLVAAPRS
jgi:AcrR family transcriptional regulator